MSSVERMAVSLRPLRRDDIHERLGWSEYPNWARYSDFYCFSSEERLWNWCNAPDTACYAVVKEGEETTSLIGLLAVLLRGAKARASVMLRPDYLATGLGGRLILRLLVHCFVFLRVESVEAVVAKENGHMLRIARKLGASEISGTAEACTVVLERESFMDSKWFSDRYIRRL